MRGVHHAIVMNMDGHKKCAKKKRQVRRIV
jgi:hypothetical protein